MLESDGVENKIGDGGKSYRNVRRSKVSKQPGDYAGNWNKVGKEKRVRVRYCKA